MRIFKPYEDEKPESKANSSGNIMEPQYKERYDEHGHAYLEKVGEVNTYEKIQSFREECDVMSILSRYAAGDQSVLATPGYYIDTSKLPKTYTEYLNMMNEQREKFDALPLEIRKKFEMNFESWIASAGEESWLEKMGIKNQQNAQKNASKERNQEQQNAQKNASEEHNQAQQNAQKGV